MNDWFGNRPTLTALQLSYIDFLPRSSIELKSLFWINKPSIGNECYKNINLTMSKLFSSANSFNFCKGWTRFTPIKILLKFPTPSLIKERFLSFGFPAVVDVIKLFLEEIPKSKKMNEFCSDVWTFTKMLKQCYFM